MRSVPSIRLNSVHQAHTAQILLALVVLRCMSIISAEGEVTETIAVDTDAASPAWSAFLDLCDTIAPYCGVVCFLAPLPTINQIARDRTVGNLPLLPYSSMVSNSFVWVTYGLMKNLPSVWGSNAFGVLLGAYYFTIFVQNCGPMASNLPGTAGQHLKGTGAIILVNLCLAASGVGNASEYIGREGVIYCIILFASPLAALRHVIATKSAASIPLPFTLACLINCTAWFVVGWWKLVDFNIYFPNLLGIICAVVQLALKGVYGNRAIGAKDELPR